MTTATLTQVEEAAAEDLAKRGPITFLNSQPARFEIADAGVDIVAETDTKDQYTDESDTV